MTSGRVVYVIATAAPPVRDLPRLFELLQHRGWDPYPILTPTAATWIDVTELADAAGFPTRVEPRLPSDEEPLPPADAVLAAPLSFNTVNKWATGISDTFALGLLNELLGVDDVSIVAAPCVKTALRRHPAYAANLTVLSDAGVAFLDPERTVLRLPGGAVTFDWPALVKALTLSTKT